MGFTPERRGYLVAALGEEAVRLLEEQQKEMAKELYDRGIEFKEFDEPVGHGNFGALLDQAGSRSRSKTMRPSASAWASRVRSDVSWVEEAFGLREVELM